MPCSRPPPSRPIRQETRKARLRDQIQSVLPEDGWAVEHPKDALQEGSFLIHSGQYCTVKTTVGGPASRDIARYIDIYFHAIP